MKKLFAGVAIALFSFTRIADELKTVTLMDKVTMSLPGAPKEDSSKGIPMQTTVLADSTEISAFVLDFSKFGMTEEMLQQMAGTDQFKQMMEGQAASQSGVKIVSNKLGKYNDKYTMYDIIVDSDNETFKGRLHERTIFYKKYGINMIYKPGTKAVDEALKNKIFNSLKIAE